MRRLFGLLAIAVLTVLAVVVATAPEPARPSLPPSPSAKPTPPIDYWDWGANRVLTPAERDLLKSMGSTAVFSLCGAIYQIGNEPTWTPQGRPSSPPPELSSHLVIRIDSDLARIMDAKLAPVLVPMIAAAFARIRTPATVGVQLDCDVPTKRLAVYADFLHQLRGQLPSGCQLSVTMLLDWVHSPNLALVMGELDFIVPQFYSAALPVDSGATSLILSGDLERVVQRLERIGLPYRIGLPTFEQCSHFAADGSLARAAVPLSPEAALTAGARIKRVSQNIENTLEMDFAQTALVGGMQFEAGSHLLFGAMTASGLARQFARIRALAPRHCLGTCLFRLPGRESTRSLSIAQAAAAQADRVRPATLSARLVGHGGERWTLIISNRGDDDWIDFANPARVSVEALGHSVTLGESTPNYAFIRTYPTRAGRPSAPLHADGCAVDLALLRAGQVLTIEDLHITGDGTAPAGVVQWSNQRAALEVTAHE